MESESFFCRADSTLDTPDKPFKYKYTSSFPELQKGHVLFHFGIYIFLAD